MKTQTEKELNFIHLENETIICFDNSRIAMSEIKKLVNTQPGVLAFNEKFAWTGFTDLQIRDVLREFDNFYRLKAVREKEAAQKHLVWEKE